CDRDYEENADEDDKGLHGSAAAWEGDAVYASAECRVCVALPPAVASNTSDATSAKPNGKGDIVAPPSSSRVSLLATVEDRARDRDPVEDRRPYCKNEDAAPPEKTTGKRSEDERGQATCARSHLDCEIPGPQANNSKRRRIAGVKYFNMKADANSASNSGLRIITTSLRQQRALKVLAAASVPVSTQGAANSDRTVASSSNRMLAREQSSSRLRLSMPSLDIVFPRMPVLAQHASEVSSNDCVLGAGQPQPAVATAGTEVAAAAHANAAGDDHHAIASRHLQERSGTRILCAGAGSGSGILDGEHPKRNLNQDQKAPVKDKSILLPQLPQLCCLQSNTSQNKPELDAAPSRSPSCSPFMKVDVAESSSSSVNADWFPPTGAAHESEPKTEKRESTSLSHLQEDETLGRTDAKVFDSDSSAHVITSVAAGSGEEQESLLAGASASPGLVVFTSRTTAQNQIDGGSAEPPSPCAIRSRLQDLFPDHDHLGDEANRNKKKSRAPKWSAARTRKEINAVQPCVSYIFEVSQDRLCHDALVALDVPSRQLVARLKDIKKRGTSARLAQLIQDAEHARQRVNTALRRAVARTSFD
ncbi:unnamed protein product, partial [Amoebophrya sp. A25]